VRLRARSGERVGGAAVGCSAVREGERDWMGVNEALSAVYIR
jgi:hypothetical protein